MCLGYLAVVATVYNLWRTGAVAVDTGEDEDSTWAKPAGLIGELEREKRTLLKAIKEAEFDHEMGKLSKVDADAMIQMYRHRAIEVIKELERVSGITVGVGTKREQIEREVRARLEVESKAGQKKKNKQGAGNREQATGKPGGAGSPEAAALAAIGTAATVPVAVTAPPDDDEPKRKDKDGVVAHDAETVESGGVRVAAAVADAANAVMAAPTADPASNTELPPAKGAGNAGASVDPKSGADSKADTDAKADDAKAEGKNGVAKADVSAPVAAAESSDAKEAAR